MTRKGGNETSVFDDFQNHFVFRMHKFLASNWCTAQKRELAFHSPAIVSKNNCGDKAASNSITIQYCYPKQYWLWLNRNGHGLMLAKSYRYRYLRATTRPWGPCHRRTRTKSYHLKPIQDPARRSSISSACCWQ